MQKWNLKKKFFKLRINLKGSLNIGAQAPIIELLHFYIRTFEKICLI